MNKPHIPNNKIWFKTAAIVVLQGFVLFNIATVESLSIYRILPQNKHLRKQNSISLSRIVPFGEQKITKLRVLLAGFEKIQFPIKQDGNPITLREAVEEQPYDGYTFPMFDMQKYTKEVLAAQYKITCSDGDKSLHIRKIEELWSTNNTAVFLPDTLLSHAQKEWEIIVELLNGDSSFGNVLGNPHLEPEKVLILYKQYFEDEFRGLNDNNMAVNFIAHLLLLHDLGKRNFGEQGHAQRSAGILNELFKGDYFGFSRPEKNLLQRIVGGHSRIDKIGKSAKDYEDFRSIVEETVRERFFTEMDLLDISRIWIMFRIAEGLQAQHFGFIDTDYFERLKSAYDTAGKIIRETYDKNARAKSQVKPRRIHPSYETQQEFQRLPKPISNSI